MLVFGAPLDAIAFELGATLVLSVLYLAAGAAVFRRTRMRAVTF